MIIDKNKLEELYITKNWSAKRVSEHFGCGRTTLYKKLRDYGLVVKSSGRQQKYFANDEFFDNWSHNMAYCIGFIAADGHVWKNRPYITIGLKSSDIEILEFIRDCISPDTQIRSSGDKVQICIKSKQLHKRLINYNINNNKTFGFKIDYNIPNKYFGDFIRGYFDGDGSIHKDKIRKDGSLSYRGSIVSASEQPLEYFVKKLRFGKIRVVRGKYYEIQFNQKDLLKLKEIIYRDTNCFALKRKKDKFDKINYIHNLWTEEEDNIIIQNIDLERKKIAKLLPNRSLVSVYARITKHRKNNEIK
jgi:hypothetical protein